MLLKNCSEGIFILAQTLSSQLDASTLELAYVLHLTLERGTVCTNTAVTVSLRSPNISTNDT